MDPLPYGLLVMHAMDIYRQKTCPPEPFAPPPPPGGGTIIGYIMGIDTVLLGHPQFSAGPLQSLGHRVCYGTVVRQGPQEIVVSVRGTDGFVEWVENGQFLMMAYAPTQQLPGSTGAHVEQGFWGIYATLTLTGVDGSPKGPLANALLELIEADDQVVVAGHSLGAALATYLTIELARGPLATRVSGCFFASPHPGDQRFAALFDQLVQNYALYNYLLDIVPRVPPSDFGYCALPRQTVIEPAKAKANIRFGLGCNHHIVCYLAMLDYDRTMQAITPVPAGEEGSAQCIKGPHTGQPTIAKAFVSRIAEVVR